MNDEELKEKTAEAETAAETAADGKKAKVKKSIGREILEWVLTIAAALVIAFVVRTFIFEPVKVDGASMNDTLVDGEVMIVTKFEYSTASIPLIGDFTVGGNPKRFDVVICHYPGRGSTNFVKRVIGIPGDTLKLENGYLYLKAAGETEFTKYDEPYISEAYRSGYLTNFPEYTVPEGSYFVMGDHRNNSNDSRSQGPITRDMIVGKVACVVWPFSSFRTVANGLDFKAD